STVAAAAIQEVFLAVSAMNPSKDAVSYWQTINRAVLGNSRAMDRLWGIEKQSAVESITVAKREALSYLESMRVRLMRLSHTEAIKELVKIHKLENKIKVINSVVDNGIFEMK